MFSRARAAFASAVNMAAIALGLSISRGPMPSAAPHEPRHIEPPRKPRAQRNAPRKRRSSTSWWLSGRRTHAQEMGRRCRQIAREQLTTSNGLWYPEWHVNSHGTMIRH